MAREMKDSGVEWIGKIPTEWELKPLKMVLSCFGRIGFRGYTQEDLVDEGEGPITLSPTNIIDSKLSLEKCSYISWDKYYESPEIMLNKGDIVFVKTASVGKCAIYDSDEKATVNPQFVVLKDISCDKKFLFYSLISPMVQTPIALSNFGSVIGTITQKQLLSYKICIPSLSEQACIASFLDTECSRIDSVIERTRASIEEYKKLKQAVITQAVTKGIRPNREMKDSGIEWVGEMPVEWESITPKALFSQRKEKAIKGERQLTASQQHGVIYQDEYMELTGTKIVTVEKDFDILKHVEAGDFVISMRSFQGGLEYSTKTGSISSAYVMLIPNLNKVFPRFFRWLLKSSVYINALQSTTNMVRDGQAMRYSNFVQIRLYEVPLLEQEEIADYLDDKIMAVDTLIVQKEQLLTELESYKKSLIFEYVTGKKEVPA